MTTAFYRCGPGQQGGKRCAQGHSEGQGRARSKPGSLASARLSLHPGAKQRTRVGCGTWLALPTWDSDLLWPSLDDPLGKAGSDTEKWIRNPIPFLSRGLPRRPQGSSGRKLQRQDRPALRRQAQGTVCSPPCAESWGAHLIPGTGYVSQLRKAPTSTHRRPVLLESRRKQGVRNQGHVSVSGPGT